VDPTEVLGLEYFKIATNHLEKRCNFRVLLLRISSKSLADPEFYSKWVPCGSHDCRYCAPRLRYEWHCDLMHHLRNEPYVEEISIRPRMWPALYRKLASQQAGFAKIEQIGTITVFTNGISGLRFRKKSRYVQGALAEDAVNRGPFSAPTMKLALAQAIAAAPVGSRTITTSRGWKKPTENSDKPKEFYRIGTLDESVDSDAIMSGLGATVTRVGEKGSMYSEIPRQWTCDEASFRALLLEMGLKRTPKIDPRRMATALANGDPEAPRRILEQYARSHPHAA